MPQPEEVDEINEFLLKRREKQRMGELPREDYAPGFAKKISLAIFGKPRVEEKSPLKSTQPTYASSQAQEAMRQQLDEIMESRPTNQPRASTPSPKPTSPAPPTSKPAVPHYYSNMPYPPYIQRGLASLPAEKKIATPNTPSSPRSTSPTVSTKTPLPIPTPVRAVPAPASPPISKPNSPPPAPPVMRAPPVIVNAPRSVPTIQSSPVRPVSPLATNSSAAKPPAPPTVSRTAPSTATSLPKSSPLPTNKPSVPFWKKLFGKKENAPIAPTSNAAPSAPPVRPTPYYAAPAAKTSAYTPISTISPVSTARDSSSNSIAPVSPSPPKKLSSTNPLLPAVTPASAVMKTNPIISPAKSVPTVPQPIKQVIPIVPEKKINAQPVAPPNVSPSAPPVSSAPYVPPWVARTMTRNAASEKPAPTTLPWKQPFGTETNVNESIKQQAPAKKVSSLEDDDPSTTLSKEISGDELEHPAAPETHVPSVPVVSQRDEVAEEEISEEEALEKLPFEEVEGLSASDLDYLSQKEKEHRKAQEEKDGDLGIPSELKNTLNRQSSQLEGVLQGNNLAPPDEKQEILRRLKKMMEDEGHS